MSIRALLLATVAVASLSAPALAQVAEVEGKVTGVTVNANGAVTQIKVFNTTIPVPTGPVFSTPTRDGMTRLQIGACNATPFAGLPPDLNNPATANALFDGTAIVVGTSADVTNATTGNVRSVITAESIFVEPAENVLLGRITRVPTFTPETKTVTGTDGATTQVTTYLYASGTLEIEHTPVVLLGKEAGGHFPPVGTVAHNACLPGLGIKNDAGFALPPEALAKDAEAAAEGWYGKDGKFYAFLIESVGADPNQKTAVSILRAQCRQRTANQMEWEVRGGTADPLDLGAGTVNIGYVNANGGNTWYGVSTTATADPVNQPYGLYTFKGNINGSATSTPPISGTCPQTVAVRYNGIVARAGVDVR